MEASIHTSVEYLKSTDALLSIKRDPYWPKWDSPWWHMMLLWELGLAERIPQSILTAMIWAVNAHYVRHFPAPGEPMPKGLSVHRHLACHCALGSLYQMLTACKVKVDQELPWLRPWFLKYQLWDGGFNCDEKTLFKPVPKSSIVSTLPPLEAVLYCTPRPLTREEGVLVDRGAVYLMNHRLFRRALGDKEIINQDWLKVSFPRFFEYDYLRGLRFLARWSEVRRKEVPRPVIEESLELLRKRFSGGKLVSEHVYWDKETTLVLNDGQWSMECAEKASVFPLLHVAGQPGRPLPPHAVDWLKPLLAQQDARHS